MRHMKKIGAFLAVSILFTGCGSKEIQEEKTYKYEEIGFDSAEDAVTYCVDGLKKMDIDQMLKAYAWETQAKNYKYDKWIDYNEGYNPISEIKLPEDNDYYVRLNTGALYSSETLNITCSIFYYIVGEDGGKIQESIHKTETDEFMDLYDNERYKDFSKIENVRFVSPDSLVEDKAALAEFNARFDKYEACFGADEVVCLAALADVGDKTLYFLPTVARYGEKWYIVTGRSPISFLAGIENRMGMFLITDKLPPK